jgi:hypothetical protein
MSASAVANVTVAVRNSSPMRTAVFLVDAVVGSLCCTVGAVTVDTGDLLCVRCRRPRTLRYALEAFRRTRLLSVGSPLGRGLEVAL